MGRDAAAISRAGATSRQLAKAARGRRSGTGGLAGRVVGPVAVDADDAPVHAPVRADHAAVLDDRVADRAPLAVGNQRAAGAEAARDRAVGPGAECDLPDLVETLDPQIRVPEPAFLGRKVSLDRVERPGILAGRELGVEPRAPEVEGLLEPVGGERGSRPRRLPSRRRPPPHPEVEKGTDPKYAGDLRMRGRSPDPPQRQSTVRQKQPRRDPQRHHFSTGFPPWQRIDHSFGVGKVIGNAGEPGFALLVSKN